MPSNGHRPAHKVGEGDRAARKERSQKQQSDDDIDRRGPPQDQRAEHGAGGGEKSIAKEKRLAARCIKCKHPRNGAADAQADTAN